jgi:hypothetical protein
VLTHRTTLLVAAALGLAALFVQTDAQAQMRISGFNALSSFRVMPAPIVRNSGNFNGRLSSTPNLGAARSVRHPQQDVRKGRVLITVLHDASGG